MIVDLAAFRDLFQQESVPAARGKFLSRVFGIFSESIVQIWAEDERAPYRNLGRPTLCATSPVRNPTLDFLFECRRTGRRFVAEQKCEIEFNGFRYFTLTGPHQLKHHNKPAFAAFLAAANGSVPAARDWKVGNQRVTVDGAVLVWGAVTPEGRAAVMEETGLHDVIGLDRIIAECAKWKPDAYCRLVNDRRRWCEELFAFLDR
ncbi:MAG: hypothetical protein LBV50_09610 [Novosphingobium sp.]|nr:hypothetical protein [Novosphingobium sp.]